MTHMHTDLMSPSGLEFDRQKGGIGKAFEAFIMGHGVLAARHHRHAFSVTRMSTNRFINRTVDQIVIGLHHGQVTSADGARLQLPDQIGMRFQRSCDDTKSRRFLVQAMNDTGPGYGTQ